MNKLVLKWRRLLAMNYKEIVYRLKLEWINQVNKLKYPHPINTYQNLDFIARKTRHDLNTKRLGITLLKEMRQRDNMPWQQLPKQTLLEVIPKKNKNKTRNTAGRICNHQFDVLDKEYDLHPINWHYDIMGKKTIPLKYGPDLDCWNSEWVQEVRYVWELNRHQHFITLAKAFYYTSEIKYAKELFEQWTDWMQKNPVYYGINWTSSLEMALRIISWTWALGLARSSAYLTVDVYLHILYFIERQADYISKHISKYSSANNHTLGEALGLIYVGCYFPELKHSHKYLQKGFNIFIREIIHQVHPDGVLKEQAIHYQLYICYYVLLVKVATEHLQIKIPWSVEQRMRNMVNFVSSLMDSYGNIPNIGDEDGGLPIRLAEQTQNHFIDMLYCANHFGYSGSVEYDTDFCEPLFWLAGNQKTESHQFPKSDVRTIMNVFQAGGYSVINHRDDSGEQHFVFDFGPLGLGPLAAHGHADASSFTLFARGERLLIDAGTYLYLGAGKWRQYFRGTRAHNTVVIDEQDQSQALGPFQWGKKARSSLKKHIGTYNEIEITGTHDGYEALGVIHERSIKFDKKKTWTIHDRLIGSGTHHIQIPYHLGNCKKCEENHMAKIFYFEKSKLHLYCYTDKPLPIHYLTGKEWDWVWYSDSFGRKQVFPVALIDVRTEIPLDITTKIQIEAIDLEI